MLAAPLNKERLVSDWFAIVNAGTRRTVAVARSADPSLANFFADDAKSSSARSTELQKSIEALLSSPAEKALFAAIGEHRKNFIRARDAIMQLKREGRDDEALKLLEQDFQPVAAAYLGGMTDLVKLQRQDLDARAASLEATNRAGSMVLWVLTACAVALGAGVSWFITRRIGQPLRDAAQAAQRVAAGDLTTPLHSQRQDETGDLLRALEDMRVRLVQAQAAALGALDCGTPGDWALFVIDLPDLGGSRRLANAGLACETLIASLMNEFAVTDRNRIKPGIAEATRAVLRRVPEAVLVRDKDDAEVAHLLHLATQTGVSVHQRELGNYRAVTVIAKAGDV